MGRRGRKIEDDWHYKMLIFFLKLHGLHSIYFEKGILSKTILYARSAFLILQGVFFFHCSAAILVHLTQDSKPQLRRLVSHLQYAGLALYTASRNYDLLARRTDIALLLKDCRQRALHCTAEVDDWPIWRKYTRMHSVFCIGYLLTAQMCGVILLGVASPFWRFIVKRETPTHVFRPIWYPANVLTTPALLWTAAIYEWILLLDSSQALMMPDLLYLYFVVSTVVKYETLGQFFANNFQVLPQWGAVVDRFKMTGRRKNHSKKSDPAKLKRESLKKGIHDWNILWRETKLINGVFYKAANWCVLFGVTNNAIMPYMAVIELRSANFSGDAVFQSVIFFYHVITGTFMMYASSYASTLLQNARETLRHSLWQCDWFRENLEFKKLFLGFNESLFRSVQLRVLKIQPYNVEYFSRNLSRAFSYVTFLLQLSRPN